METLNVERKEFLRLSSLSRNVELIVSTDAVQNINQDDTILISSSNLTIVAVVNTIVRGLNYTYLNVRKEKGN